MLKIFTNTKCLFLATAFASLCACSTMPEQTAAPAVDSTETILLVSMDDGSIIRQTVGLDADICVKMLENPATTCLTQGDAIVNDNGIVVGYEMVAQEIQLQGRN